MKNSNLNMKFPHGADTLQGNVSAPGSTTPAETLALAVKALRAAQRASENFQQLAAVTSPEHLGNGTARCFPMGVLRLNSETDEGEQMSNKEQTMHRKYCEDVR
jgi:hypothetical protein